MIAHKLISMSMGSDNSGIAYGLIYIVVTLIVVAATWIILGVLVDEFDILANNLLSYDMCGDKTMDAVVDLKTCWDLILWLTVGCSFLYAIVTAIRKERGDVFDD